ncbi:UNC93-like protein MFSD11 isoform X2 [Halyomorpha halys]|uniref:UNC93-like protein MFSD11 isoform X2 n=1 Tax=Halyomorpha halys TaxID=286706 RepID=UPI0006D50ECA|nr:UNC93-like protein MFSD11 isoform X2 [Halyomorpha halys]
MDKRLFNVLHLGLGFMFVFTAFQTLGNIERTILESVTKDDPSFNGNAYISLAVIYTFFALGNWLSPSLIASIGPRMSMVIGSFTYLLFIASFFKPMTWLLYFASVIMGLGASIIWTGQGNYLTLNSDDTTMSRNSGVFWALLQCSMLFGNFFVYMAFNDPVIEQSTRLLVTIVLSALCGLGCIFMLLLRPAVSASGIVVPQRNAGPIQAFVEAVSLMRQKEMVLLCVTFFYTGLELSFFSGVYGSCIGATLNISDNPKQLVGLSGILIGIGEIAGGLLFGLLSSKTARFGRDPIVLLGFVVHIATYFCIFLNLPDSSPLKETTDNAIIKSSGYLAIACSFLLGFGDSCFNTQIYAAIGTIFSEESAPAFAVFKFTQSIAAAAAFFYSNAIGLYIQLGILIATAVLGTVTFCWTERIVRRKDHSSDSDRIQLLS